MPEGATEAASEATAEKKEPVARFPCGFCAALGNAGQMIEAAPGLFECKTCHSSLIKDGNDRLPRLLHAVTGVAMHNNAIVKEPIDLGTPDLRHLLEDVWLTILFGRYNAAIVLMGVLIEALVKHVIRLNEGTWFRGELGPAIKHAQQHRYLRGGDVRFLQDFKNQVRNPWQHQDIAMIVRGRFTRMWPLNIHAEMRDGENMISFMRRAAEEIRSGERKPVLVPAELNPVAAEIVKQQQAERIAMEMYEQVWEFTLQFRQRYLRTEAYEAYHRKFGSPL